MASVCVHPFYTEAVPSRLTRNQRSCNFSRTTVSLAGRLSETHREMAKHEGDLFTEPPHKPIVEVSLKNTLTLLNRFFTPYFIQCLGENLQDGALCENCPVRTAAREANPNNNSLLPAYVLSLGTGSATREPSSQRLWGRLADYLDRSLDSGSVWSNFVLDHPHLQRLGRLHRFDLDTKYQIRLDSVDEIPNMMQRVRAKYQNSPEIAEFRLLALVNMFYFELTNDVQATSDGVLNARILCRWQSDEDGFDEWQTFVYALSPRVFVNGQLCGTISADMFGNLQCLVRIPFDDRTSIVRCQIQLGNDAPIEIGDSPFEVSTLRRLQGFDSPFAPLVT